MRAADRVVRAATQVNVSDRQAEYAVHREAANDRLGAIEATAGGVPKIVRVIPPRAGGGSKRSSTCSGTIERC